MDSLTWSNQMNDMLIADNLAIPEGFIPVSKKWPNYSQSVLFMRKDGTIAKGACGDNGVYFGEWGWHPERKKDMLAWKPLEYTPT